MRKIEQGSGIEYVAVSFADMISGREIIVANHEAYLRRHPLWLLFKMVDYLDGGAVSRLAAWVRRREYTNPTYADIHLLSRVQHWPVRDRMPDQNTITLFDWDGMAHDFSLSLANDLDPQFLKQNSWAANRAQILWRLDVFPELDIFYLTGIGRHPVLERIAVGQPVPAGSLLPQPSSA